MPEENEDEKSQPSSSHDRAQLSPFVTELGASATKPQPGQRTSRNLNQAINGSREHFPNVAEAREENRAAGGVPKHITYTHPDTGFVTDEWVMEAKTPDGHTFTYLHRTGGLPALTTRDPKTGIVTAEEYAEYGVASPRPDGLKAIYRDHVTGIGVEEHRLNDGVETYIERDRRTGIVTYEDRMRDGKLEAAIWRDPKTGADTGQRARNKNDETVGPPAQSPLPPKAGLAPRL